MKIKTDMALKLAGNGTSNVSALARVLGVKRQSIQKYGEHLPVDRAHFLIHTFPEWFTNDITRSIRKEISSLQE